MSDDEELFCRLCAEPTPLGQLITPDEGVIFTSKVITKLSWINVDILSSGLPRTICFSCFDLLERTWSFLNNVRTAQEKLRGIFFKKPKHNKTKENSDLNAAIIGKPVDKDWEDFERPKVEIKIEGPNENSDILHRNTVVIPGDVSGDNDVVKTEDDSENYLMESNCRYNTSTDSDVPLKVTKKKKLKRKRKKETIKLELENEVPIDILPFISWENQTCRCGKCNALCKSILSLQIHSLQIHNQCCQFKCIDCDKIVSTYKSFVRHIRTHNSSLRHCCEYCYKVFLDIKSHKLKEHKDVYKTKCINCGATFETSAQLEEHKSMFYKENKKSSKKLNIKIKNDEQTHYKCEDCNKSFKSRPNLQQHRLLHTERSRNFSCHVCGKMFYTKGSLGTHMITHEEVKPYKCDHCPLAFRARGNLISHLSLHTGLKPFICEQCGKSFRVKRHLMSHAIVHTDLRPYVCEYCNKAFRFKTRLNLHLRQHTGVKPYKCIYCQRDFTNGSNYKKHMSRRHGIDTSTRLRYNNPLNKESINGSEGTT